MKSNIPTVAGNHCAGVEVTIRCSGSEHGGPGRIQDLMETWAALVKRGRGSSSYEFLCTVDFLLRTEIGILGLGGEWIKRGGGRHGLGEGEDGIGSVFIVHEVGAGVTSCVMRGGRKKNLH